jgi:hypothetical protein
VAVGDPVALPEGFKDRNAPARRQGAQRPDVRGKALAADELAVGPLLVVGGEVAVDGRLQRVSGLVAEAHLAQDGLDEGRQVSTRARDHGSSLICVHDARINRTVP